MSEAISRRGFLALSATPLATAAISVGVPDVAAASPIRLTGRVGYTPTDVDPFYSTMIGLGSSTRMALDYDFRSVGADLGGVKGFTAVELVQEGALSRLNSRDLALYVSADNRRWQRVDDVEFVEMNRTVWLYLGAARSARYLKVHAHRGDKTGFTCVLRDIQSDVRVYNFAAHEFTGGNGGGWGFRTPVVITNANAAALRDRAAFLSFQTLNTKRLVAEGKLAADLRDLRIADASGRELHAYSNGYGVFVRVPQIAAKSSITVYAYSGNPKATNRIDRDTGALQVQYGHRVIRTLPTSPDAVKVAQLAGNRMVAVSTAGTKKGLNAQYSGDGGRSWGAREEFKGFSGVAGAVGEGPQGMLWDSDRGVLTLFFRISFAASGGDDFTDPKQRNIQTYVIQTRSFTSTGRPKWDPATARHIPLMNRKGRKRAAWALSYTNPIRTSSGAYMHVVSYIVRPDGTFVSAVVRSADGGLTWTQSTTELTLPDHVGFERGITEPAIAQLRDGSIAILARQQAGRKYHLGASRSTDDGVTWSPITDSTVLSSNTQPSMFPGANRGLMLSWSGHNAFSETSYYRNNLTAAFSDDDGASWHGHHDLLGATELSVPGWGDRAEIAGAQNADSAPSTFGDRLFNWVTPGKPPTTMLVEQFERYVRDSHGALDTVNFQRADGNENGTELSDWRWWRSSRTGSLDFITGQRATRRAVRLRSAANVGASASRLFPAIRTGLIRCAVKLTAGGGGLRLCLQEGFSKSFNAPGTVLSLLITPSGEVRATTDDTYVTTADIGIRLKDTDPTKGPVSVGQYGTIAYDTDRRSLGADLYTSRPVSAIELIDNDLLSPPGTRLCSLGKCESLRVWRSDDNMTWTPVPGWTGTTNGSTIRLTGPSFKTRFVKVTQPWDGGGATFANDRPEIMRVFPDQGNPQVFRPLAVPTRFTTGKWHQVWLNVNLPGNAITVTVDGEKRATFKRLHAAEVVSHLFLAFDAAAAAGDVAMDELIVQDTSGGMPTVTSVGSTTPVP